MQNKGLRIAIGLLTGFVALTAMGDGVALLTGAEGVRFPLTWLQGTPFPDYTLPALLLVVGVGGISLVACVAIVLGRKASVMASMLAGSVLVGYIVVEAIILKQEPPGPTPTEIVYFSVGLAILLLAVLARRAERRPQ